jgi:hypothetical protein
VVSLADGAPSLTSVISVEGSPYGMALTHDGRLLIVASDDRVAFLDTARLTAGSADAIVGYLNDAPMAGRVYANVTPDDQWLFHSRFDQRSVRLPCALIFPIEGLFAHRSRGYVSGLLRLWAKCFE